MCHLNSHRVISRAAACHIVRPHICAYRLLIVGSALASEQSFLVVRGRLFRSFFCSSAMAAAQPPKRKISEILSNRSRQRQDLMRCSPDDITSGAVLDTVVKNCLEHLHTSSKYQGEPLFIFESISACVAAFATRI